MDIPKAMEPGELESFEFDGQVRKVRDGHSTSRQLLRLNDAGALFLVEPGSTEPISRKRAAFALDEIVRREAREACAHSNESPTPGVYPSTEGGERVTK